MSFVAKYRGVCEDCGGDVLPGQEVAFVGHHAEGEIRHHPHCPTDANGLLRPAGKLCPRCFVELSVTGQCGNCDE